MPPSASPVFNSNFREGTYYTRKDIFNVLGFAPHPSGGNWFTGYHTFGGTHYIFCNVGTAGRTGHEYGNRWESSDRLRWYGKNPSTRDQPQIRAMTAGAESVLLFCRDDNRASFKFFGPVRALSVRGKKPVEVLWQLAIASGPITTEEVIRPCDFFEGATTRISVNAYERSASARLRCIQHHGCLCSVCGFDFRDVYGELGRDFIHVHHVIPLAAVGERYRVDPVKDLRPVCPNCHAMVHRWRDEPLTIAALQEVMRYARAKQIPGELP